MVKLIMNSNEIPKDKKVIIDFFATWCGPCQKISPLFENLSKRFPNIEFLKVDVDQGDDISIEMDVFSLPTFIFMDNGSVTIKLECPDFGELERMVEKFVEPEKTNTN